MSERYEGVAGETLFRGLLESAPDAMVIVDRDARIVLVNGQALHVFGYEHEELIGQPIEMLMPPRFHDVHPRHRDEYLAAPTTRPMGADLELFGRRKDGSEFPVDISLSAHETPAGQLVVSAIRDVTGQKAVESEIRRLAVEADQANAAKSEFLSRMSHELRTPLNAIIGFGQLLDYEDELDESHKASVGHILRAGRHLLSLINEILDMAQIESGRVSLSLEPVSLGAVVADAVELVEPLAGERSVTIDVQPPAGSEVLAFADQQRLLQVVLNLVGNAVKFNHAGGSVNVAWWTDDGAARLEVADTGPGIPEDQLSRIFQPFERLDSSAAETEGTGLGLALAKSLVEAMDGRISVRSAPGEGATFALALQAAEHVSPAADSPGEHEAPAARRTLLHIEDNLLGQQLVARILKRVPGLRILSAMDGPVGLALARRHRPDIVLLDLGLPGLDGEEVLSRLRADPLTRDIPVVVLSADNTRAVAGRMRAGGAVEFLTKPVDPDVLAAVVDELSAQRD